MVISHDLRPLNGIVTLHLEAWKPVMTTWFCRSALRASHQNQVEKQSFRICYGKEFAGHAEISEKLDSGFYFCTPYHSWERGLNENTNGLVRQYFPKGTDFATLTATDVQRVEDLLNNRPRKALNYYSPNEVFAKLTAPPENYALGMWT